MSDLVFDTKKNRRVSVNQLRRSGLSGTGSIEGRFIDLVTDHGIDTDLYIAIDTGETEVREGKAYVVFEKKRRKNDPEKDFDVRAVMKSKVNEARDTIISSGFKITFGGEEYTLQTRDDGDFLRWKELKDDTADMPEGTPVGVRVESNAIVTINSEDVHAMLVTGRAYFHAVRTASWTIKDAIRDAETDDAAFDVYEAMAGQWPDSSPLAVPQV